MSGEFDDVPGESSVTKDASTAHSDASASLKVAPEDVDKTLVVDLANDETTVAVLADDATVVAGSNNDATTIAGGATTVAAVPGMATARPQAGKSLVRERFELLARLGKGGMGQVFKARDLRRVEARDKDPFVAIKFLGEEFSQHPDAFVSLQREARKSQQLAHPNIVTVYDFDRDGDQIFMTMEYLDGRPLSGVDELERELGKTFDRADLIAQMAEGLGYAHQRGVIHSDFKPDNVFVTREGRVKVLDFGIARVIDKTLADDSYDAGTLGALTMRYASLEMIQRSSEPHPADDLYALGLVACQLLTGQHPYQGKNALEAWEQKVSPLAMAGVARCQRLAIAQAIRLPRNKRTQSVDQFLAQFSGRSQRNRRIVAAILVVILGVGYWAYEEGANLQPAVPFDELPVAVQTNILKRLETGQLSIDIGDWDGASRHYLAAYELHPRNPDAEAGLDQVALEIAAQAAKAQSRREKQYFLDLISDHEDHPYLGQHAALQQAREQLLNSL